MARRNRPTEATALKGTADLQEWHAQNEAKKRDRDAANKSEESAFVEQRDETTPGSEWERVGRLVDLSSKSTRVCTKDTSRLKSLLIQLKQTGLSKNSAHQTSLVQVSANP